MAINSTKKNRTRINQYITAEKVRLVDPENILDPAVLGPGEHTGIMGTRAAQQKATKLGMDLVEVSPNAEPPVVRVMDFGKHLFGEKKKQKVKKPPKLKEIKLRPVTEAGDYQVKVKSIINFLKEGNKAKVTIRFKGREITHKDLGLDLMAKIKQEVLEHANIDQEPKFEGRQIIMVLSPKK